MHRKISKALAALFVSASTMVLITPSARACDVPVYKYALERWTAEAYPVLIFHREPLGGQAKKTADYLQKLSEDYTANIQFMAVDLEEDNGEVIRDIWSKHESDTLPHMVALHTRYSYGPETLWTGPPSVKNAKALVDSPTRAKIARKILDDKVVAVWTLLESGDKQADDDAEKALTKHVAEAEELLRQHMRGYWPEPQTQPSTQPQDQDAEAIPPVPKISFSVIRISRDDAAEEIFIKTLLTTEKGLNDEEAGSYPMAFPVFGRGRSLFALIGEGINRDNVLQACALLTGPCACPVKYQNPGVDMLFTANWDSWMEDYSTFESLGGAPIAAEGEQAATRPAAVIEAETTSAEAGPETASQDKGSNMILISILATGGVVLVAVATGGFMLKSARRKRSI